jgi:hypothetical protein
MTFTAARALCLVLAILVAIGIGASNCPAQPMTPDSRVHDLVRLPKLCMPVGYREASPTGSGSTRVAMLGDRYREVNEALAGWNETGMPLVGRNNGRWEPVPCGDDTGLFYIVPLLARTAGWSADRSLDFFLLGTLFISAAAGIAGLWLGASGVWQRTLAIVPISLGAYLSYKLGDVYLIQGSVVLMLIPWLVYSLRTNVKSGRRFLVVFLSGVFLGLAHWVRTQSGSPVLVFFAVLVCFSQLQRSIKIFLTVTLMAGMSLPLLYAQLPLHDRDTFLVMHEPGYRRSLNSHLIWHTAFLGLSYLTNPYVPAWRDSVAVEYAQAIDPAAIYGGEEYEAILRSRVEEIIRQQPRFILNTVAAKSGVLAWMLLLSINIGLGAAILAPKPLGTELAFWLAMAVAGLPGILAIPEPQYVLGMIAFALCYWYYSVSFYLERSSAMDTATAVVPGLRDPHPNRSQPLDRVSKMEALFSTYPRSRPALPSGQQASYVEHYRSNRAGKRGLSKLVAKLESWMHRRVSEGINGGTLLEIGAGNLNHFPYLPAACVCDAVEPFQELWQGSPHRSLVRHIYSDLRGVPPSQYYDCIFSVAVLEHLIDLPLVLASAGLLLREGGTFRAGFPSEGGLLWGLSWRLTTGIEYRLRRGLDYGAVMRHEHLNTAREILMLLSYFYERVDISRFPLPFDHLSFYITAIAHQPRLDRCRSFLVLGSASGILTHE